MTNPVKARSFFSSPLAIYTLAVAFVFTLGFFIHFGREAQASKSWQYVLSDGDPLYYWSVAKGRMMTPRCDGNPFYYEEQGLRHIIPFTSAEAIGLLAKYTGIPLSWFFPAWQILMPLFTWLVILLCCWKLWGYSLSVSAPGVLILLLLTLFCPWPGIYTILTRFSRPLDGMAPLFLWISLIFKGDPGNRKHRVAIILTSSLTLWLHPYNAALGLWVTVLEYVRLLVKGEQPLSSRLNLYAIGSCFVSGLFFAGYIYFGKNINPAILDARLIPAVPSFYILITMLILFFVVLAVLCFHLRFKKEVTLLDRFMIEWALWGVLVYVISKWVLQAREAPIHMLYFAVLILFSLAGWIYEKLCVLKGARFFSEFNGALMFLAAAFLLFSTFAWKNLFAVANQHYFVYITQYFFILFFSLWLLARFDRLRNIVFRKRVIWAAILLMAVAGYWRLPVYVYNRNFPFDGGYQWLKRHAKKNDVVLTATEDSRFGQYLFLETGLKSYFYIHGGTSMSPGQVYRRDFVLGLLLGLLGDRPDHTGWSLEQKLHVFKLDYILIPKPSPFFDAVAAQLRGHLLAVYEDPKCFLWKVVG